MESQPTKNNKTRCKFELDHRWLDHLYQLISILLQCAGVGEGMGGRDVHCTLKEEITHKEQYRLKGGINAYNKVTSMSLHCHRAPVPA